MNNGRIRHATETFVNNLIAGVKKLIESNTKQIEVLSREALKYIGSITTFSQVDKTGYYTIAGCLDDTIPVQYGTLRAYLDGSEKTVEATGYYGSDIVQCSAAYNNNTKQWKWKQCADTEQVNVLSSDRGYINSKEMKDFNACVKNGKYTVYFNGDGVAQHAPPSIWAGDNTFSVDVTQQSDTVLVQEICGIYGPNQGRKFYRVNTFGTWTDWKEIATTSKTDILCTLKPNFTKEYDDSHKVNNVYYLDFSCTKSTPLSVGKNDVCTVPFSVGNKRFPVKVLYATDNNVVLGVGEGFLYYSTLEVYPKIANVSKIYVSGAVSL